MSQVNETQQNKASFLEGPETDLEKMYIREYLEGKGYRIVDLLNLPREKSRQLMTEACIYASGKLAEIESRVKFRNEIQYPQT